MRTSIIAVLQVLGASALAAAQTATTTPTRGPGDSTSIVLAADTHIPAVTMRAIATRSLRPSDTVYLQTTISVMADSRVAIPAGTYVVATVSSAARRGWLQPKFELVLSASTFTFANGYVAAGPSLASESSVGDNGVRRDDPNVTPALIASMVAGDLLAGPVAPVIGAGLFVAVWVHPNQLAMEAGAPVELVLDRPLTLDARRVADAARVGRSVRLTVARRGRDCFDAGSPGTPDIIIPGDPGTPGIGDIPGTPPTPPTSIPGAPGTPAGWKSCL
jgi:hypothetical protein